MQGIRLLHNLTRICELLGVKCLDIGVELKKDFCLQATVLFAREDHQFFF